MSLAAQIFSNSVSVGMSLMILGKLLTAQAAATADFVGRINDMFDSCNGSTLKPLRNKIYHCAVKEGSPHLQLWEQLIKEIQNWKFVHQNQSSSQPQKKRKLSDLKSQVGWLLTLNSITTLYKELKVCGFQFLMPRRLNQDCLENFFSCIRGIGGHNTNPTVYEFISYYKIATVNSVTRMTKYKNCEADDDIFILDLIKPGNKDYCVNPAIDEDDLENDISSATAEEFDFVEINIIAYLAGYIARRSLESIKCEDCVKILVTDKVMSNETMFIYLKDFFPTETEKFVGLYYPTNFFFRLLFKYLPYL